MLSNSGSGSGSSYNSDTSGYGYGSSDTSGYGAPEVTMKESGGHPTSSDTSTMSANASHKRHKPMGRDERMAYLEQNIESNCVDIKDFSRKIEELLLLAYFRDLTKDLSMPYF